MSSTLPIVSLRSRERIVIAACLTLVIALAWGYLYRLAGQMASSSEHEAMMAAMGMTAHETWTIADFSYTFVMWVVMMVGMMTGSAAPMVMMFAAARRGREERMTQATALFVSGYLLVWVGFSAVAALAQSGLQRTALLSTDVATSSAVLAGVILIAAGAYQLTPLKNSCLAQCKSPFGFLLNHWRQGSSGALVMGLKHGAYCLGCCWALMTVLFAVGVMNLLWVAALAAFVLAEKLAPPGARISQAAGIVLIATGLVIVAR